MTALKKIFVWEKETQRTNKYIKLQKRQIVMNLFKNYQMVMTPLLVKMVQNYLEEKDKEFQLQENF